MNINDTRRLLHLTERALGDYNALRRGRLTERVTNRIMGRIVSRAMSHLWR